MGSSGSRHHTFAGGGTVIFILISQVKLLKHKVNPPPRCTQEPHEDPGPGQGLLLQSQRCLPSSPFSLPLHESEKSPKNSRLTWSRPWRKEVTATVFSHSALVSQQGKRAAFPSPEQRHPLLCLLALRGGSFVLYHLTDCGFSEKILIPPYLATPHHWKFPSDGFPFLQRSISSSPSLDTSCPK